MLQDIMPLTFHNEYKQKKASTQSKVFHFKGKEVYVARDEENHLKLPRYEELGSMEAFGSMEKLQFLFSIEEEDYFLLTSAEVLPEQGDYHYESVRTLRQLVSKEVCFAVMTAYHLYMW